MSNQEPSEHPPYIFKSPLLTVHGVLILACIWNILDSDTPSAWVFCSVFIFLFGFLTEYLSLLWDTCAEHQPRLAEKATHILEENDPNESVVLRFIIKHRSNPIIHATFTPSPRRVEVFVLLSMFFSIISGTALCLGIVFLVMAAASKLMGIWSIIILALLVLALYALWKDIRNELVSTPETLEIIEKTVPKKLKRGKISN